MTKKQLIAIGATVTLLLLMFFGLGTKPKIENEGPAMASKSAPKEELENILKSGREGLKDSIQQKEAVLQKAFVESGTTEKKFKSLKGLASFWYEQGNSGISGIYAKKIAELLNTAESWQIAGTTFRIALQSPNDLNAGFYQSQAQKAFEQAIKLDTANIGYKVQEAMVFVDRPEEGNPMKGILMLRELNQKYPKNAEVIVQLGRLSIKTGQWQKAIDRFTQAIALEPQEKSLNCLLAEAYAGAGNTAEADRFSKKCPRK